MKPDQLPVKDPLDIPINNIYRNTNIWPDEIPYFVGSHNYVHLTYCVFEDGESLCENCAEPYGYGERCKYTRGLYPYQWHYILQDEFWCSSCGFCLFEWLSEIEDMALIKPELVHVEHKKKWLDDL